MVKNYFFNHITSASRASIIAFAAEGGGTYITVASALVASLHSFTDAKTGKSKCFVPIVQQEKIRHLLNYCIK